MDSVKEILETTKYGVLATVTKDQSPWGVPVGFVYDEGSIYFRSSPSTVHIRNLEHNPQVSFTVFDSTQKMRGAVYIHSQADDVSHQPEVINLLNERFGAPPVRWKDVQYYRIELGDMDNEKSIDRMYYFRSLQHES